MRVLANMEEMNIPFQHTGLVTSRAQLAKAPDIARRVIKSFVEGIHLASFNSETPKKAFRMGFTIDILCPSASLVFISIVAATVAPETPLSIQFMYGGLLVLSSLTWYSLQSLVFSQSVIKKALEKSGCWVNRVMGVYMVYFAFKLITRTLH